jgi:hypothetical protein
MTIDGELPANLTLGKTPECMKVYTALRVPALKSHDASFFKSRRAKAHEGMSRVLLIALRFGCLQAEHGPRSNPDGPAGEGVNPSSGHLASASHLA